MSQRLKQACYLLLRIARSSTFQAIGLAVVYAVIASLISLSKHWTYNTYAFDLGIFVQSLQSTLHGDLLYNSVEGMSHFGYHFQPILFLLTPVFWLAPHAETLLIVQSITIALGGYLLYRFARIQQMGHGTALLVEVLLFLSPLVHGVNFHDFHPVVFVVPTVLLMLIGLTQKRWGIFGIGLPLSLMTKEDVVAALAVFGAVMLMVQYKNQRNIDKAYLVMFLSSLGVGILAILLARSVSGSDIPPMLTYIDRWSYGDVSFGNSVVESFHRLFSEDSIRLLRYYFVPLAFMPLLSPALVLPALLNLGRDMFVSAEGQKQLSQYPALAIPFLFAATVVALRRIQDRAIRCPRSLKRINATKTLPLLLIAMIVLTVVIAPSPLRGVKVNPDTHDQAINSVIALIPKGASVTVSNHIFPHVCTTTVAYSPFSPVEGRLNPQYVVIDLHNKSHYTHSSEEHGIDWEGIFETEYGIMAHIDGVVLLKRPYTGPLVLGDSLDTDRITIDSD